MHGSVQKKNLKINIKKMAEAIYTPFQEVHFKCLDRVLQFFEYFWSEKNI
jgi:hypothetical protein